MTTHRRNGRAAARLVTCAHKYDHGLSQLLHDELHWIDVSDRASAVQTLSFGVPVSAEQSTEIPG